MANCDDLFKGFYERIILTESKRKDLQSAREALRGRIRTYFKEELDATVPFFNGQGSFYLRTIVNPLLGKKYDIDDGIYLQNLPLQKLEWPATQTAHDWIYDAVKGHTEEKPIDKGPCIRVVYTGDYHVDLAIYGISDNKAYLAEKNEKKWIESDPKAFSDWFKNKITNNGEQLQRIICCLKAWSDNQSDKMLKGIAFTISASNNFEKSLSDDECLVKTAAKMSIALKRERQITKPVVPYENLLAKWTSEDLNNFITRLDLFALNGSRALVEKDKNKAAKIWIEEFGDRFPAYQDDEKTDKPDINIVRSRVTNPWS